MTNINYFTYNNTGSTMYFPVGTTTNCVYFTLMNTGDVAGGRYRGAIITTNVANPTGACKAFLESRTYASLETRTIAGTTGKQIVITRPSMINRM